MKKELTVCYSLTATYYDGITIRYSIVLYYYCIQKIIFQIAKFI